LKGGLKISIPNLFWVEKEFEALSEVFSNRFYPHEVSKQSLDKNIAFPSKTWEREEKLTADS
jgi:hypothetical protein